MFSNNKSYDWTGAGLPLLRYDVQFVHLLSRIGLILGIIFTGLVALLFVLALAGGLLYQLWQLFAMIAILLAVLFAMSFWVIPAISDVKYKGHLVLDETGLRAVDAQGAEAVAELWLVFMAGRYRMVWARTASGRQIRYRLSPIASGYRLAVSREFLVQECGKAGVAFRTGTLADYLQRRKTPKT